MRCLVASLLLLGGWPLVGERPCLPAVLLLSVLLFGPCLLLSVVLLRVSPVIRWPVLRGAGKGYKSKSQGQRGDMYDSRRFHRECLSVPERLHYCRLLVVVGAELPMASPDTTSSTLRFCWRPPASLLDATGSVLP